jgi:hypothetical protein
MFWLVSVHMVPSRNGTTSRAHKEASLRDLSSDFIVGNEFRPSPVHTTRCGNKETGFML